MIGKIVKVNYKRSLAIFEDNIGDFGYFEILGNDDLEVDDVIIGNLHSTGREIITKQRTNRHFDVYIEDYGMSLKIAMDMVFR